LVLYPTEEEDLLVDGEERVVVSRSEKCDHKVDIGNGISSRAR
jgi:hypothetical protein